MIDFEHVSKTYETHNDENVALEDINIHIDEGEFVFILGHSGAGKSTFLKLIQMEEKPTEGKVFINGQDLTRIKRRKVPYLRRQMGVVFQDFRLIPTMTVYENVAFAMRVTNISTKKIKARVPFALSLVGLEDKMDRLPDELSGGEQQRVAVARALAHGPKIIIADEPTGNIDPEMSLDIMQLFEAINKVNITVVVVTHEHELVHKLAAKYNNRVITLADGMVASDTAHPEVARRYAAKVAARSREGIRRRITITEPRGNNMRFSSFTYLVGQGLHNLRANRLMTFASMGVLTVCMLLIGAAYLLGVNIDAMVAYIGDQNETRRLHEPGRHRGPDRRSGFRHPQHEHVVGVTYVSPQEVLSIYSDMLSDYIDLQSAFANDNPFYPTTGWWWTAPTTSPP